MSFALATIIGTTIAPKTTASLQFKQFIVQQADDIPGIGQAGGDWLLADLHPALATSLQIKSSLVHIA